MKMNYYISLLLFTLLPGVLCAVPDNKPKSYLDDARFDFPESFSANQVSQQGNAVRNSKIYRSGDKQRRESGGLGVEDIQIIRHDLKKIYMIRPAQKVCFEIPLDSARMPEPPVYDKKALWEPMGKEKINGIDCEKYRVAGANGEVVCWIDKAKKVPVRIMSPATRTTITWDNFVSAPQPKELFEPPFGYKIVPKDPYKVGSKPGTGAPSPPPPARQ